MSAAVGRPHAWLRSQNPNVLAVGEADALWQSHSLRAPIGALEAHALGSDEYVERVSKRACQHRIVEMAARRREGRQAPVWRASATG